MTVCDEVTREVGEFQFTPMQFTAFQKMQTEFAQRRICAVPSKIFARLRIRFVAF
jgi:hypothetical protein